MISYTLVKYTNHWEKMNAAFDTHLLGSAPAFLDLMDRVSRAAPMDRPVLVIGERGTGKELIAARLHFLSKRWGGPYLQLNCASLSESLLDSELFGHEAGAFTGATRAREGRFEAADDGTLFLDEIATLSDATQEKLLRVVEYGSFQRVGSNETRDVDVRIIGATNVDLPSLADSGAFRADLLDRLSFDVLTVPPLRHRRDDILELAEYFARTMAGEIGWMSFPGFTKRIQSDMLDYDWPGNIRQLKNTVERALYQWEEADGPIDAIVFDPFASPYRPKAKPSAGPAPTPQKAKAELDLSQPMDFKAHIEAMEAKILSAALSHCRYNQRQCAAHLGLSYDQLRHALKKHGLGAGG